MLCQEEPICRCSDFPLRILSKFLFIKNLLCVPSPYQWRLVCAAPLLLLDPDTLYAEGRWRHDESIIGFSERTLIQELTRTRSCIVTITCKTASLFLPWLPQLRIGVRGSDFQRDLCDGVLSAHQGEAGRRRTSFRKANLDQNSDMLGIFKPFRKHSDKQAHKSKHNEPPD